MFWDGEASVTILWNCFYSRVTQEIGSINFLCIFVYNTLSNKEYFNRNFYQLNLYNLTDYEKIKSCDFILYSRLCIQHQQQRQRSILHRSIHEYTELRKGKKLVRHAKFG